MGLRKLLTWLRQTPWLATTLLAGLGLAQLALLAYSLQVAVPFVESLTVQPPAMLLELEQSAHWFDRPTIWDEARKQQSLSAPLQQSGVLLPQLLVQSSAQPVQKQLLDPLPVAQEQPQTPSEPDLPNRINASWPETIQQWGGWITKYADDNGLDPNLVAAVMYRESWFPETYTGGWNRCPDGPNSASCTSTAGAIGPMQVMPLHQKAGENLRDVETNIKKGCAILRTYIDYMGSELGGLAAYNAGPGGAKAGGGWGYAKDVLKFLEEHK